MEFSADHAYGPDERHRYDVYDPGEAAVASVLLIHGGGWWQGDKAKEKSLATTLANAGYLVVVPNYRLAGSSPGANTYPTQVDDVATALVAARDSRNEAAFSRLAVMGGSSGGNLAVEIGIRFGIPVVSWSGLLVLDEFMQQHQSTEPKKLKIDPAVGSGEVDQSGANDEYYKWLVLNLVGSDDPASIAGATPLRRISRSCQPMLLVNSLAELVPKQEVLQVASALAVSGVGSQTLLLPGSRHAEGYTEDALAPTMAFLSGQLGR